MFPLHVAHQEMNGAAKVEFAILLFCSTVICLVLAIAAMPACIVLGRLFTRTAEFVLHCLAHPEPPEEQRLVIPLPVLILSFLAAATLFGLSAFHVTMLFSPQYWCG